MILALAAVEKNIKNVTEPRLNLRRGFMNWKLFFCALLVGLSLQAQTQNTSTDDELDDGLDIVEEKVPALPTPMLQTYHVYQVLMPKLKQHELTPTVLSSGTTATDKNNQDMTYKQGFVQSTLSYFYGFKNNQAFGAQLDYFTGSTSVELGGASLSQGRTGIGNPSVHYKGLFHFTRVSIFTKVSLGFKIEKESIDGSQDSGNAADGQNKLFATFGFYHPTKDDNIFGAFVKYTRADVGERMEKNPAGNQTFKLYGGDTLDVTAFTEFKNEYHPNFYLSFVRNFSQKTTDQSDLSTYSDTLDVISFGGSVQIQTGDDIFFIPEAFYGMGLGKEAFSKYTNVTVSGSMRFLF
jgi:hypothetical protein